MTGDGRTRQIAHALEQYRQQAGPRDTMRVPLLGNGALLEVIEVPLDLPLLNPDSFRIAPALSEHPQADLVRADPYSAAAQRIVAQLVRGSHRYADDLRDSLIDGQDQPGLITRTGKLVNGNTRCVLLRELRSEGVIRQSSMRVGVLPAGVMGSQELELESILQKQIEHKDEYNLVSELMMLKKLHEGAGLTDAAIARHLRIKPVSRVTELREALELMERARRLTDPVLPLTTFIAERDKAQNWIELLRRVREVDNHDGRSAGDLVIGRWLIAYVLGIDSVHRLRHARGEWVESDVIPDLAEGEGVAASIADAAKLPADEQMEPVERPEGVDILGEEPPPPPDANAVAVQRLLNIAVAASRVGDDEIRLGNGSEVAAADVRESLIGSVSRGLEKSKKRTLAGTKLERPGYELKQVRNGLREVLTALDEVGDLPEFSSYRASALALLDEVSDLHSEVTEALQRNGSGE